jgi:hypothetical protein
MSDRSGSHLVMAQQQEADTVWRNLNGDARQIAAYVVTRCGDFTYDTERAAFIAAFLTAARAGAEAPPPEEP